jgi:DNA-binding HxlR family transcriptional regulator
MESSTIALSGPLDPREGWVAERCPIARTLEVVSTKSAFLILREAFYGTTRFDDFAKRAQVSDPVAAARLSELVEEGLLEREPYQEPGQRTRHAYRLTEKGADLLPTLVAMMQWGNRWLDDRGGPVELRHTGCGGHVRADLRCEAGHNVTPNSLVLSTGRQTIGR